MKNKELFRIFMDKHSEADLFNEVEKLIERQISDAIGAENACFYLILRKLSDSINNPDGEVLHTEQISLLINEIFENHEKYISFYT
ncbi:MAG: hypothetical protein GXP14_07360 [Gammaproteobacteria bacterium]|nr:hypothetical protein [Gammaproteobacteria bacterium]